MEKVDQTDSMLTIPKQKFNLSRGYTLMILDYVMVLFDLLISKTYL